MVLSVWLPPDGEREDFAIGAVAGGTAGQAFTVGEVAAGIFHMNGEPAGLALEGGKLAGFVVLQDFFRVCLRHFAGSYRGGGPRRYGRRGWGFRAR